MNLEGELMVKVSVNLSHPKFAGLDPKKIRVVVGSVGIAPTFYPFITRKPDLENVGEANTNDRIFDVSTRHPVEFTNAEFALLGKASGDTLLAGSTLAPLVDFVREGILIVEKDGVAQTYVQLLNYTP